MYVTITTLKVVPMIYCFVTLSTPLFARIYLYRIMLNISDRHLRLALIKDFSRIFDLTIINNNAISSQKCHNYVKWRHRQHNTPVADDGPPHIYLKKSKRDVINKQAN